MVQKRSIFLRPQPKSKPKAQEQAGDEDEASDEEWSKAPAHEPVEEDEASDEDWDLHPSKKLRGPRWAKPSSETKLLKPTPKRNPQPLLRPLAKQNRKPPEPQADALSDEEAEALVDEEAEGEDDEPEPERPVAKATAVRAVRGPQPPLPGSAPPSSFSEADLEDMTAVYNEPGWTERAFDIFLRNGFVLVTGLLKLHQYSAVLRDCENYAETLIKVQPKGNRGTNRWSFGNASYTNSMFHVRSWSSHLLRAAGSDMRPLLDRIFNHADYSCVKSGGDFVVGNTPSGQQLHSDIQVKKSLDVKLPPPYVCVNFTVQPLTEHNGPMRIAPGTQLLRGDVSPATARKYGNARLCPMPAGAAIVRDVRTLHSGTPNLTEKTRYLPSVEFASAEYYASGGWGQDALQKSMPREFFEKLPPDAQELCSDIVFDGDEDPVVGFIPARGGRGKKW